MKGKYKKWTKEDIDFVNRNIDTMSNIELSKHFGVSVKAIETIVVRRIKKKRSKEVINSFKSDQSGSNNNNWKGGVSQDSYKYKKIQIERYPEKVRARDAVHRAIKSDKLNREPCKICGSKKVQAHHEDYSKPLEVIWFCKKHHDEHHRIAS